MIKVRKRPPGIASGEPSSGALLLVSHVSPSGKAAGSALDRLDINTSKNTASSDCLTVLLDRGLLIVAVLPWIIGFTNRFTNKRDQHQYQRHGRHYGADNPERFKVIGTLFQ